METIFRKILWKLYFGKFDENHTLEILVWITSFVQFYGKGTNLLFKCIVLTILKCVVKRSASSENRLSLRESRAPSEDGEERFTTLYNTHSLKLAG